MVVRVLAAAFAASLWCGAAGAQPPPRPAHAVIAVMENKAFEQIIGSAQAPYINSLIAQGALLTNSHGVTHPSQPNYLALFSGSLQGVGDNGIPPNLPFTTVNLAAQLRGAGRSFGGYSEGLPYVGYEGESYGGPGGYWRKHNPWVNWQQIGAPPHHPNTLPPELNMPFANFPSDYAALPDLAIVVPTQSNDMHDGTIPQGDAWLQANLDSYVQWAKSHDSLFILTWDEDDGAHGNHVATLFVGAAVRPGAVSDQLIDHYNVLATLQDMHGLQRNGATVGVPAIGGIFAVPEPSASALAAIAAAAGLWLKRRRTAEMPSSSHCPQASS